MRKDPSPPFPGFFPESPLLGEYPLRVLRTDAPVPGTAGVVEGTDIGCRTHVQDHRGGV